MENFPQRRSERVQNRETERLSDFYRKSVHSSYLSTRPTDFQLVRPNFMLVCEPTGPKLDFRWLPSRMPQRATKCYLPRLLILATEPERSQNVCSYSIPLVATDLHCF